MMMVGGTLLLLLPSTSPGRVMDERAGRQWFLRSS
jgi:hypothetical protein